MKFLCVLVEGVPVQREGDVQSGQHPEYRVEQVVKHTAARSEADKGIGGMGMAISCGSMRVCLHPSKICTLCTGINIIWILRMRSLYYILHCVFDDIDRQVKSVSIINNSFILIIIAQCIAWERIGLTLGAVCPQGSSFPSVQCHLSAVRGKI